MGAITLGLLLQMTTLTSSSDDSETDMDIPSGQPVRNEMDGSSGEGGGPVPRNQVPFSEWNYWQPCDANQLVLVFPCDS